MRLNLITMRFIHCLLAVVLIFGFLSAPGQQKEVDSLRALINNRHQPDSVKTRALATLAFLIKYDEPEEAKKLALKAIILGKNANRYADVATAIKVLGILADEQGKAKESINHYINAILFYRKAGDTVGIARCECNIGMLYRDLNQNREAFNYFARCLPVFLHTKFTMGINMAYQNMGICYFNLSNYDSALYFFHKALDCIKQNNIYEPTVYGNIGNAHSMKGNHSEAKKYLLMALNEYEVHGDTIGARYFAWKVNYATELSNMGNYKKALDILNQVVLAYKRLGNRLTRESSSAYLNMAGDYASLGDYEKAYRALRISKNINDSLYSGDFSRQMNDMKEKYEADKKELMISNLAREKQLLDVKSRQRTLQVYLLFGGVSVLLVFLVMLWQGIKRKKRDNAIIQRQKEIVEEKNQEIVDSITYAKRLQDAILPPLHEFREVFPESFVLYKPKDIVAGDFYFLEKNNTHLVFAVADCTGHGVPGAMVSVICANALTRCVKELLLTDPGKILDATRDFIMATFEKSEQNVQDGMDISLISIPLSELAENNTTKTIYWAGAFNPLLVIHNGAISKLEANRQTVGKFLKHQPFTTHQLVLEKGSCIYLFSDGLADQFGGPKKKKLRLKPIEDLLLQTHEAPMLQQQEAVTALLADWQGNLTQIDDICLVGIRM